MSEAPTMMNSEENYNMNLNVANDPWLPVSRVGSTVVEPISLRQAFRDAGSIEDIQIDFHAERQAVMNFLTAVFYRAVTTWDDTSSYKETVLSILDGDIELGDVIDRYLDSASESGEPMSDRFNLIDETHPFLQVPGWKTKNVTDIPSLFSEVVSPTKGTPVESTYASRSAGQISLPALASLSLEESVTPLIWAAQGWIVKKGIAVYDDGSAIHPYKPGAEGQFFGSGGTDGTFFLVPHLSVVGNTLLRTLTLSSPDFEDTESWSLRDDAAFWELPTSKKGFYDRLVDEPRGPADLLTFPRSAVLIIIEDDRVIGAHYSPNNTVLGNETGQLVAEGKMWAPENYARAVSEYAPSDWSRTKIQDEFPRSAMSVQTSKNERSVDSPIARFHPNSFSIRQVTKGKKGEPDTVSFLSRTPPSGSFWEGIGTLTALGDKSPRIIQWVRELVEHRDVIPEDGVVEIRYTRAVANNGKVESVAHDVLYLASPVARGQFSYDEALNEIANGVTLVLEARTVIRRMEGKVAIAMGVRPGDSARPVRVADAFMEGVRPELEHYIATISEDEEPEAIAAFFRNTIRKNSAASIEIATRRVPSSLLGISRTDDNGNPHNVSRAISGAGYEIRKMTEVAQ